MKSEAHTEWQDRMNAHQREGTPDQPQSGGIITRGGKTILMVDDEVDILNIGRAVLEKFGYQVITAQSGEEALTLYSEEAVDSVVLDLGMPGMGGINCLKELLAKHKSARIVISSGYVSDDHMAEIMSQGARAFLSKPFHIENLVKTVRRVLDE
ncbi:MAG: response regulator [Thermodesulfobacteriota bacterium]